MERADLERMTATKLREYAMEKHPGIQGDSGMQKEDLIEAIIAEEVRLGLRPKEEKRAAPAAPKVGDLKAKVRALRADRDKALAGKDSKVLKVVRTKMKRLKRQITKLKKVS
ncbi:MAG: Rho termination factor N-terminal domain-containing protein [candidate division NC10 bacterium]|nr:Rho termination factor N-terminal domain-containing protein [candidate division NC10 bacterium]